MKMIKFGFVALALAMVSPAVAQEEGAIGWTPVAIGLASPVQLPWGRAVWDVFGLDLNAFYSDAPKMYGIGIGGLAMACRDDMMGLQVGGLCNWNNKDVYGMRLTAGGNISFAEEYGFCAGLFAVREDFWGLDIEFIGSYQNEMNGVQIGGLANVSKKMSYGASIAGLCNWSPLAYGFDLAIFNYTAELHGCQLGVVNFARECPWGFQIGLVNIILDNKIKVLPIVNGYF